MFLHNIHANGETRKLQMSKSNRKKHKNILQLDKQLVAFPNGIGWDGFFALPETVCHLYPHFPVFEYPSLSSWHVGVAHLHLQTSSDTSPLAHCSLDEIA